MRITSGGKVQEPRVHVAQHRHGPFHQAGHLVQQPLILDQLQVAGEAQRLGGLDDPVLPLRGVQDHVVLLQLLGVGVEVLCLERLARAHETVTLGGVAAGDAVDLERHDLAVEHTEDAAQRAHPAHLAGSGHHRLGPREVADDRLNHLGHDFGRRPALAVHVSKPDAIALREVALAEAGLAQEAFEGLFGGVDAGALQLLVAVLLCFGQALGHQRQATCAAERLQRLRQQSLGGQPFARQTLEIARGVRLHPGGDLFREQFEQKLGHQAFPPSDATQASAHILQRSRMRPI